MNSSDADLTMESPPFFEPYYRSLAEVGRTDTDWNKYAELLEVGAAAGDDHACYALASLCLHGVPLREQHYPRNVRRGLALLRRATRSVHLAMTELAAIYESGELGVRRNRGRAFELFERAVKFGSITARFHLGRCYYFGIGTRRNRPKAMQLFRAAAKLGFPVYQE